MHNKKVLLRERKRHTARRIASVRYAALSCGGGYPIWGVAQPGLDGGGTPSHVWGVPHNGGYPGQVLMVGGVPQSGLDGGEYPIPGLGGTLARS